MDKRALLLALVAMLTGSGLLALYLQRYEREVSGGQRVAVLVLARDAPAGSSLTKAMLGSRDLPQRYLESRHLRSSDLEQVVGARLAVAAHATEALLFTDLASGRDEVRSLSSLVPEGQRAFAITPAARSQAGLIAPGDRVDVLLVAGGDRAARAGRAQSVAENLLVLAVGDDLGDGARAAAEARRAGPVSVAATPEQCRALADAERQGVLRLVLRHPDDLSAPASAAPAQRPEGVR